MMSVSAFAQSRPDMGGTTFRSADGATLDFYSSYNKVVFQDVGSNISRSGEWTILSRETAHGVDTYHWTIKVEIYVGERIITWTGRVVARGNGKIAGNMSLNGKSWELVYQE